LLSSYPSVNYILVICRSVFADELPHPFHEAQFFLRCQCHSVKKLFDLIRNFVGIFTEALCCSPSTRFL
jgi:hypothetical protein